MAATIFYTVGALTGLFGRLYVESKTDTAADDHDLTLARIVVTPVRAGLDAVGGVLLTAMLSLTVLKSPALQASNQQLGQGTIYNLNSNTFGIIIAAVFGLTPNLFINFLQAKPKGLADQLQKSGASEQAGEIRDLKGCPDQGYPGKGRDLLVRGNKAIRPGLTIVGILTTDTGHRQDFTTQRKAGYTVCIAFGKHRIARKTTFRSRALFLVSIRGGYARRCIRTSLGTTGRTPAGYEQSRKTFRFSLSSAHSIDRARTGNSSCLRALGPSKRALTRSDRPRRGWQNALKSANSNRPGGRLS
jgi:hypothetical protein